MLYQTGLVIMVKHRQQQQQQQQQQTVLALQKIFGCTWDNNADLPARHTCNEDTQLLLM